MTVKELKEWMHNIPALCDNYEVNYLMYEGWENKDPQLSIDVPFKNGKAQEPAEAFQE